MVVKHDKLQVEAACEYLKNFASPTRLRLLCALAGAERSVSDLARTAGVRMATTSQQLAVLRREGIVMARRSRQTMMYRIADEHVVRFIEALAACFCPSGDILESSNGGACDTDQPAEKGI